MLRRTLRLVCFVTLLAAPALSLPQAAGAATPPGQEAGVALEDPAELEAFLDGVTTSLMDAYQVPGITVSVVKDGGLFLSKGYGYADVEARVPVAPEQTLFRVGSIAKLLTWTAVMQLVEAGRLDLDADVNQYLDFQIPATYAEPITLRHLMTHTPGFEDNALGLLVLEEEKVLPLGEGLAGHVPARVFRAGEIAAYSNYGAGLAGYIVERVAGMPFHEYVDENILQPLGMEHTTFVQPAPAGLVEHVAKGYLNGGTYRDGGFEFVQPYPAGSLSATANDMAAFMIAHLQDGRYGEGRILQEETAREMHRLQYSKDERLGGWGLGFSVGPSTGAKTFGHGGDTIFFHSGMLMLPEHNVGVFVSMNSNGGGTARGKFLQAFLDRYYPQAESGPGEPPAEFAQRAARLTGTYYPARMSFSSAEKAALLMQPLTFSTSGDGRLQASGLWGLGVTPWLEVEPFVYRPLGDAIPDSTRLMFLPDENASDGRIKYAYVGEEAYIKQPWYGGQSLQMALLGLSMLAFTAALIAIPARALVVRSYQSRLAGPAGTRQPGAGLAHGAAWLFALLGLVLWITFAVFMGDINNVAFGLPPALSAAMYIPWILAALTVVLVAFAVVAWARRYWTAAGRVLFTLMAAVAVAHMWFLAYWNLI